jgi:hypothetical protein
VLLIKQYERNSKQLNFILNQINVLIYSYQHSMKKYLPRVFLNFTNLKQQVVDFLFLNGLYVFKYFRVFLLQAVFS